MPEPQPKSSSTAETRPEVRSPRETWSLPDLKIREAPDGRLWYCLVVVQVQLAPHLNRAYWEVRDPQGTTVASGRRHTSQSAHQSAYQACKRRWDPQRPTDF